MINNIQKNQKPIDIDAHLKYRCPNVRCNSDIWLTLKEAQTKNFKVVCDYCDTIFKPKRIVKIKIEYYKKSKIITNSIETPIEQKIEIQQPQISERLLTLCSKTLMDYGFTKQEAHDLLRQNYILNPTEQPFELIQNTLKTLGNIINDTDQKTN